MTVTTRTAITAMMVAAVAWLAGCGVAIQDSPHPVELPGRTSTPAPGPAQNPQGAGTETLFLLKDEHLVPVQRKVPHQPSPSQQLADLLAGPTADEQQQGLSSALAGTDLRPRVEVRDGQAAVELATSLEGTGRTDDILAFAQIVCTLADRDDITTVTFTRAGERVEVPRADGSLTRDPLTSSDYAPLITTR